MIACAWYLISIDDAIANGNSSIPQTWINRDQILNQTWIEQYIRSFCFAVLTMLSI